MEITIAQHLEGRGQADLLVVPFFSKEGKVKIAGHAKSLEPMIKVPLEDFKGSESECLIIYPEKLKEKRLAFLGLGDEERITTETLRRAYASITKLCNQKKFKTINVFFPQIPVLSEDYILRGIIEGSLLANYSFVKNKRDALKDNPPSYLKKMALIGADKEALSLAKKLQILCEGVHLARDLTNSNADEITPQHLGEIAKKLAKDSPALKATVFDKKRIEKEKMGLLLAVNRGSAIEPAFIILEYQGNAKAKGKDHTVVIGKGITYDTGGLNLKSSGMETMRADMAGAAVALAAVWVAAKLKLPVHLTAIVPATENCISARSYKPGDVYAGFSGKTVEITNTDAEGRLVLADALAYANTHLKPARLIDFATLTGGVDIALGNETTGMMSNNDALADLFVRAGSETFERVWRLPLFEEYKDNLKSDVADIKNAGTRSASSISGGIFLQHFVGKTPWVHFDIASTAFLNDAKRYHPKHATGIGVRLMIEFLQHLYPNKLKI